MYMYDVHCTYIVRARLPNINTYTEYSYSCSYIGM